MPAQKKSKKVHVLRAKTAKQALKDKKRKVRQEQKEGKKSSRLFRRLIEVDGRFFVYGNYSAKTPGIAAVHAHKARRNGVAPKGGRAITLLCSAKQDKMYQARAFTYVVKRVPQKSGPLSMAYKDKDGNVKKMPNYRWVATAQTTNAKILEALDELEFKFPFSDQEDEERKVKRAIVRLPRWKSEYEDEEMSDEAYEKATAKKKPKTEVKRRSRKDDHEDQMEEGEEEPIKKRSKSTSSKKKASPAKKKAATKKTSDLSKRASSKSPAPKKKAAPKKKQTKTLEDMIASDDEEVKPKKKVSSKKSSASSKKKAAPKKKASAAKKTPKKVVEESESSSSDEDERKRLDFIVKSSKKLTAKGRK